MTQPADKRLVTDARLPTLLDVPVAAALADSSTLSGQAIAQLVAAAVSAILANAPGQLDTLNELAAALGDDANFAATITAALAGKATPAQITAAIQTQATSDAATYEPKLSRAGSGAGALPVLQSDGTLAFEGIQTLIDSTPVTATDFGLAAPAVVRATSNSGQSVGNGAYPVHLDLTAIDTNDDSTLFTVDTAADKITVNASGLYLVTWSVGFTVTAGTTQETYLTKSGGNALAVASAGNTGQVNGSHPLRLSAGDYIQLILYVEGAAVPVSTQAFRNTLGLTRIGL